MTEAGGRWFTALVMSMIAIGTIYPLVFVLNVSLKDKRSYILDRFGARHGFRHEANFGDCVAGAATSAAT